MRILLILLVLIPATLSAQKKTKKYPDGLYAEVSTNKGLILLQLEMEKTPMTVSNFVGLAEGTIENTAFPPGTPYYNGSKWHRVAPGHVIQGGAAEKGKTTGPGYQFPNEIALPDLNHGREGMLNVANGAPHTNGSQWCITLGDRSYLDGDYTVFGHVVEGMDVVKVIVQGDEMTTIKILRVGKAANAFHPTTESFRVLVEQAKARVETVALAKKSEEEKFIRETWPRAADFLRYVVTKPGEGPLPRAGSKLKVQYTTQVIKGEKFVSTPDGTPYFGSNPEPFDFEIGKSTVNIGFDASVARMRKGEKRTLIIPSAQAYGDQGYYAPQRPGEKRFHISPDQTLIYEVEVLDLIR